MTNAPDESQCRWPVPAADAPLVALAQRGDGDAFSQLVRLHAPRLRWLAQRVVHNHSDAEDVVQVALWRAFEHLSDYRNQASFSAWLSRITINEGIGLLRKRRTEPTELAEAGAVSWDASIDWLSNHEQNPEQLAIYNETRTSLCQYLERIQPAYRPVLCLHAFDELSHGEIAKRLGISVPTVTTRLHRARRTLRTILSSRKGASHAMSSAGTQPLFPKESITLKTRRIEQRQ